MDTPLLWHIPLSHYSEKARWAFDYKRIAHHRQVLGADYLIRAWRATGHGTLPILFLDGRAIGDSTQIIAALEERYPAPPLYPGDAAARQRALALEDYFDEQLGPALRAAIVTPLFRHDPDVALRVLTTGMADKAYQTLRPLGRIFPLYYCFRHNIRDAKLEADRAIVNAALDRIEQERQGRLPRRRCVHGRRPHRRGDAGGAAAAPRDPISAARGTAAISAGLPRYAPATSGHAVGGRHLPAASRQLHRVTFPARTLTDAGASRSQFAHLSKQRLDITLVREAVTTPLNRKREARESRRPGFALLSGRHDFAAQSSQGLRRGCHLRVTAGLGTGRRKA